MEMKHIRFDWHGMTVDAFVSYDTIGDSSVPGGTTTVKHIATYTVEDENWSDMYEFLSTVALEEIERKILEEG